MLRSILPLAVALTFLSWTAAMADSGIKIGSLRFLGAANISNDTEVDGTLVGGLSGLDYDPVSGKWAIISDDKSDHAPARFYLARIALDRGALPVVHPALQGPSGGTQHPFPLSVRLSRVLHCSSHHGDRARRDCRRK